MCGAAPTYGTRVSNYKDKLAWVDVGADVGSECWAKLGCDGYTSEAPLKEVVGIAVRSAWREFAS